MAKKTPMEILATATENERLGYAVTAAAEELDPNWFREAAGTMDAIADGIEDAVNTLNAYDEAEREDKADAKEEALNALVTLIADVEVLDLTDLDTALGQ